MGRDAAQPRMHHASSAGAWETPHASRAEGDMQVGRVSHRFSPAAADPLHVTIFLPGLAISAPVVLPGPPNVFLLCLSAIPWTTMSSPQSKGSSMKTTGTCSLRSLFLMKTLSASGTGHLPKVLRGPVCSSILREIWEAGGRWTLPT